MKTYGQIRVFLTSALVAGEWHASRPFRFTSAHLTHEWVRPNASVDDVEKLFVLLGIEPGISST
jgi:hypothetical protein